VKAPPTQTGGGRVGRLSRDDVKPDLFDLTLERDFLAACTMFSELVLSSSVTESDFYSGQNAVIFAALLHLVANGEPTTTLSLRGHLHDTGRLAGVGGDEYLLSLTDTIPIRNVDSVRLRRLARRRRLQDCARNVAGYAGTDELPRAMAAFEAARVELEALATVGRRVPLLADCISSIGAVGPRLPIGLPQLDAATRGGIPMGKFVALLGAPGANKTNLTTWLADGWERAGCAVAFVAADESRESVVVRLGQLDGFDRTLLEGADGGRRAAFARQAHARAIAVIDPFEDRVSLEATEQLLIELAAGKPRVLIVDSVQTVPCDAAAGVETKREQIEAVVEVLKGIAKRGTLVIAISEMSRAGYRTGKREHDISALAAGAESRALEYAAHLLLGLKPVRGETGIVDIEVAKNRLGPGKPEIRVSLNFETLCFREIDRPLDDEVDREVHKSDALRTRILSAIAKDHELRTVNAVTRAAGARKRDAGSMLRELIEEGAIARVDGVYRVAAARVLS
jgi:replicative DNA helicase